jgi:RNA polymerase sigma-70 factor (ECF subfamily)
LLTARSLAIDLLRRRALEARKQSSEPSRFEASDEPGPEWHAEQRDLIQRARKAIDRLPPRQRSAVVLAYFGQRSSTEVAEIQGVPRGTVKSRIRAGIASLRQTFAEEGSRRRPIYERAEGDPDLRRWEPEADPHREVDGSPGVLCG